MAVPYYRRSTSRKEYFYHFKKIQKEIISLLLRDFAIKEAKDEIDVLPLWLIDQKRKEILESLSLISSYIVRERRRLKKYAKGHIPYKTIEQAYKSWRGNAIQYHSHQSIKNLDALYNELFIEPFISGAYIEHKYMQPYIFR